MPSQEFEVWFDEYDKVAGMYGMPVNHVDKDYYYDYFSTGFSPGEAIREELKEYFYSEDDNWS